MLGNAQATLRSSLDSILPRDPRWIVLGLLSTYLILGFTLLGFNRSPLQVLGTVAVSVFLELAYGKILGKHVGFPLSAMITGCGLSLLVNYSHDSVLFAVPIFIAVSSKYLFTFKGRHVFNPAMFGVATSLIFSRELITAAPAYQWNGIGSMAFMIAVPAMMFFMPKISRLPLVTAWLVTFTIQIFLRSLIMRHHLPFETLFWGTLSSPSFLLFTFFMITDPQTSPSAPREQIKVGVWLGVLDLVFHLRQSYYTFFFASLTLASSRFLINHIRAASQDGFWLYFKTAARTHHLFKRVATVGAFGIAGVWALGLAGVHASAFFGTPRLDLNWNFASESPKAAGITPELGRTYERLDPRVQHVAKWLLSVGDSVAVGDVDADGAQDLFFTFPLKADADRLSLYRNLMNQGRPFEFERVQVSALLPYAREIEQYGLPTFALLRDLDSDQKPDLLVAFAFGPPRLFRNHSRAGVIRFEEVQTTGFDEYQNSMAATYLDANHDGRLDLLVANVLPAELPDYPEPRPLLNLFKLPAQSSTSDERPFHFMHSSWNNARNGGLNHLYLGTSNPFHFEKQDSAAWGIPETGWSLAVGSADFNRDGLADLYVANDFGPDDFYLNRAGKRFERISGSLFNSIGKDTYKGMNVSLADVDRNGFLDIHVSNVHHDLQAEGSLLWTFPEMKDRATELGILNERRFGWGAGAGDLDNDGWVDFVQANGMVDDTPDRTYDRCPDYWYINEKIARSPPSIHSYANRWGDLRGRCIHGQELDRVHLNRGNGARPQFVDAGPALGWTEPTNSRGIALVDLNNDGRLDAVTTHMFAPPTVSPNRLLGTGQPLRHWIGLTIRDERKLCPPSGIGLRVDLTQPGALPQVRAIEGATGFGASGDPRVHFGLGSNASGAQLSISGCGALLTLDAEKTAALLDRYSVLRILPDQTTRTK